MRRLLITCLQLVTHRWQSISEAWNRFWFTPRAPGLLGMLRILTGLMLLYTHAVWGLRLHDFFGRYGWLSEEAVRSLQANQTVFSFWWWVPENALWLVHAAALVVLALFTVGLFTRVTSILAFLIVVSYANRAPAALFGLDQINAMLTLYLTIGPSGAALSLDRLRARYRSVRRNIEAHATPVSLEPPKTASANLALRLIQVHLCVIYFFAGVSKLQGQAWWNGDAMWLAFANLEYQTADMTWLASYPWLINLLTHVTVLWEISFCVLIWRSSLRVPVLLVAVGLHVGIGACLGMWTFGLVMLIACSSFLPEGFPAAALDALLPKRARTAEPLVLAYDGSSARSRRRASLRKAIDFRDRLQLVNSRSAAAAGVAPVHFADHDAPATPPLVPAETRNGRARPSGERPPDDDDPALGHAPAEPRESERQPTVLCIGRRTKTRKMLQDYLPRRGFWVMATSDPHKALSLLETNPPDCVLILGASMAQPELEEIRDRVHHLALPTVVSVTVLSAKQTSWASDLSCSEAMRVVTEPTSLRGVRREITEALEQRDAHARKRTGRPECDTATHTPTQTDQAMNLSERLP